MLPIKYKLTQLLFVRLYIKCSYFLELWCLFVQKFNKVLPQKTGTSGYQSNLPLLVLIDIHDLVAK